MNTYDQLKEAVTFIKERYRGQPGVGIVLGSGLGDFADSLSETVIIPYSQIPYFKKVTVHGHAGRLVLGETEGKEVAVLQGRYHYYEGHTIKEVVFPVQLLCSLGIRHILLTNAAGGIHPTLEPGDLMLIRDHINLMGVNPLRGANDDRLGTRFPDMSNVYDKNLIAMLSQALEAIGRPVKSGVYAALGGPSYETPAEIQMLAAIGADAVGMSTIPEAIAARHLGVRVGGVSCISNLAAGISESPLSHQEVADTANRIKEDFIALLKAFLSKI